MRGPVVKATEAHLGGHHHKGEKQNDGRQMNGARCRPQGHCVNADQGNRAKQCHARPIQLQERQPAENHPQVDNQKDPYDGGSHLAMHIMLPGAIAAEAEAGLRTERAGPPKRLSRIQAAGNRSGFNLCGETDWQHSPTWQVGRRRIRLVVPPARIAKLVRATLDVGHGDLDDRTKAMQSYRRGGDDLRCQRCLEALR
ncbi:hypothetical protein BN2476_1190010 [Paraburkholderia piptadeniae]|uniref:Uncharacterized protein n=1 Tax=Paraburkholderia piptadeniae TaxID=1701573 RepID=A0A1N7SV80_9BURK|nr:hypothetical protein BN2476_1190010 [Paraburkholderia piptadeniae]